jgi:hypothetical protein
MEKVRQLPAQLESGFENHRVAVALLAGIQAVTIWAGAEVAEHHETPQPIVQAPYHHHHAHKHHHAHHHKKVTEPDVVSTPAPIITPTAVRQTPSPHSTHSPKEHEAPHASKSSKLHKSAKPDLVVQVQAAVRKIVGDISWPTGNCFALIPDFVTEGRVGINGGKNFTRNPDWCIDKEIRKLGSLLTGIYVNSNYVGREAALAQIPNLKASCKDRQIDHCIAWMWAYNAGRFDIKRAVNKNVYRPDLAIDVEGPWTTNHEANMAALKGEIAGLKDGARAYHLEKPRITLYYAPYGWLRIMGNLKLPQYDVWLAHGHVDYETAKAACSNTDPVYHTTSGGKLGSVQYVGDNIEVWNKKKHRWQSESMDLTVPCPQPNQYYHIPKQHSAPHAKHMRHKAR